MREERFMPFGKYQGIELRDVPRQYLAFLVKSCDWISEELAEDINAVMRFLPYPASLEERAEKIFMEDWQKENKSASTPNGLDKLPKSRLDERGNNGI